MKPRANSPKPQTEDLVLGYANTLEQEAILRAAGVKRVWVEGRNRETMAEVHHAFRGRPGIMAVATDLRVLVVAEKVGAVLIGRT